MQQTEKYKLNLIEPSDPFLPEGLNANTQKVEEVLSEGLDGMDARVKVLEAKKFVFGTYTGTGTNTDYAPGNSQGVKQIIELPFTPIAVIINCAYIGETITYVAVKDSGSVNDLLRILAGGFQVIDVPSKSPNQRDMKYNYFAFG